MKKFNNEVKKMKLNKLLALLLALVMVLSLAACGGEPTEPTEPTEPVEPTGDAEYGFGLDNVNIRKAIGMAFDKVAIADNILKNGSQVADWCVPVDLATGPDGKDYRATSDIKTTYYDVAAAQEYWQKGLEELGVDSLEYTIIFDDDGSSINVCSFIKEQLETNLPGLKINLQILPKKERSDLMKAHTYDLGFCRWGPDYADPLTYFDLWTDGYTHNYGGWHDDAYMEILENIKHGELATDPAARWAAFQDAEQIIADEAVILPVYQNCNACLQKAGVTGIEFHSVGLNRVYNNVKVEGGRAINAHITAALESIDPKHTSAGDDFEVIGTMIEGLFICDKDGASQPGMAESYEISEDGLTWTFHLRDAKWANGADVTADDFVYAWDRCLDENDPAQYASLFETAGIVKYEAVDEKTFVVTLSLPCPFFDTLMFFPVFYPVNREFAEACGELYGSAPEYYLSNGPFVLTDYEPAAMSFSMVKNDTYYNADAVEIAGLNYKVILDSQSAYLAYQNGELDICILSSELADLLKNDPEFVSVKSGYLWYLSPNICGGTPMWEK